MISQFAHEYIHSSSVGNLAICQETIEKTEEMIEAIYNAKNIRGYRLLIIKSTIDVQDELLEGQFEGVTEGKFPFVYSFIQPPENGEFDFDK